jgi:dienelactone hydrolase
VVAEAAHRAAAVVVAAAAVGSRKDFEGISLNKLIRIGVPVTAFLWCLVANAAALKDEMRQPWQRGDENFLRQWLVVGPFKCTLDAECISAEGAARPTDGLEQKSVGGASAIWHRITNYGDATHFDDFQGSLDGSVGYAFANITRAKAGKALLSTGSNGGIRIWVNGKLVLSRSGARSLTHDEDQLEVDLVAGDNALLIKVDANAYFSARMLEAGTLLQRTAEIGPSLAGFMPAAFSINTDVNSKRADAPPVKVEVIAPGGDIKYTTTATRGEQLFIDGKGWPDGPYDVRCSTTNPKGLLNVTHLAWYKGDALAKARELMAEAAKADASKPEGATLQMLANMVEDRLGGKVADTKGNPWGAIHSPLMEYEELMLERAGKPARIRANGFVRLAWVDETDGSIQYARAYLPTNYEPAKQWPLVIQLHGYNPPNPMYWRWWGVDSRHGFDSEFSDHQGVILVEPHGRGNVQYMSFADSDVLRAISEAKRLFKVDEDRVYLTGESMGGWGVWNVSTRHPELFAAIAPVFGGADYHSQMSEEELAKLTPFGRFLQETQSSWSMAESLINTPIYVHHGDVDQSVNVDWSRWGVKMLQRWGYDVRYHEYPGRGHETLSSGNSAMSVEWFLKHRREPNPRQVRIRSAELRNAAAWWARVQQAETPLDFMRVDAQVSDRNVIRLDTDNVLDIVLTPGAALVDPAKPVNVVWNGVAREMRVTDGALRLTSASYKPAPLHKSPKLPGGNNDFLMTPFAIVIGTSSKNADMVALCKQKAEAFADAWKEWQKQAPRVFLDSEITDADIKRYSLILFGGADANRVTAKFGAKLPLRISADSVRIDDKEFKARDAAVQMLYPNPANAERYVLIFAGTSAGGMYFTEANPMRAVKWDYLILDGHIPAFKQPGTSEELRVVSGAFDYNWRFASALQIPGNAEVRAKSQQRKRPDPNLKIDPKVLASYVGRYQVVDGPIVEVILEGGKLIALAGRPTEMVPETESVFYAPAVNARVVFLRDASGKVTGFTGSGDGDFEAKKLE